MSSSETVAEPEQLDNPQDIPRLVLFDTWVRNRDRHAPPELNRKPNYGNVFFSAESALTRRISQIGEVRDPKIYGRFPQFAPYLDPRQLARAAEDLQRLDPNLIARVVAAIPADWDIDIEVRDALRDFLVRRAPFVAENWKSLL